MNAVLSLLIVVALLPVASAQDAAIIKKENVPYAEPADPLHTLDVYAMPKAKHAPVMFWIHGGGWETGDKSDVAQKPQFFVERGFMFVSVNYRLLPKVEMVDIFCDVAKSFRWMHDHIAEYGDDPSGICRRECSRICTCSNFARCAGVRSFSISALAMSISRRTSGRRPPKIASMR